MRRQLPYAAALAAALVAGLALRATALGDVAKVALVGLAAIITLYVTEYLLSRRR
ncbi:MAG: hypothetical protein K0B00_03405 [Rhodobacteraceae bacterium]|nr:hypothetical protein [Paracoccaceae bacterium]